MTVEQVINELPLGVRGAAIDDVTTRRTDGGLRIVGAELPLERKPGLREVDGVRDVRVGRHQVQGATNDQRAGLMATQDTGGEGPGDLQAGDVAGVDLLEPAEASAGVVASCHGPFAADC